MELSPTQQSLLDAMQAAQGKKLIRYEGGYWCIEGTPLSQAQFSATFLPRPYWRTDTVDSSRAKGLIKRTEESKGQYWGVYVLADNATRETTK